MKWIQRKPIARLSLCWLAAVFFSAAGLGQTGSSVPTVTIGVTPLVIGSPATIWVLVTNPVYLPLPTGQVSVDFGDGSTPANLSLSNTWVGTTYTYTTPGVFTVTASYSGDSNFAPANASLTAADLTSVPVYTLQSFGDSMTGGQSYNWLNTLIQALGWNNNNFASPGAKTDDEAPAIYQAVVDGSFVASWMLGANDSPTTAAEYDQFQQAVLAQNAWLAIPEGPGKQRAQASTVNQTGDWQASDIYTTTGLVSLTGGSTLTATVPGNVVYLGLTSTLTTDYTVDVVIDGVDQGQLSPVSAYEGNHTTTEGYQAETYGVRFSVGGPLSSQHVVQVTCVTPGTTGCYIDWIGGNGSIQRPNLPPFVLTAVSYTEAVGDPNGYQAERQQVDRNVIDQLKADGLPLYIVDIASFFNGPAEPQCVSPDEVHPSQCGSEIEQTVFLSAANFLATEAQRIDIGSVPSVVVGQPLTLDMATATSGLPVTYTLVSGPGTLNGNQLNFEQAGTLTVEADQAGNSSVLPAQPAPFNVSGSYATTTGLTTSASSSVSGASITFTATVSADGTPASGGSVTFMQGGASIGSVPLNTSGQANLITSSLPVGTDFVTASYGGDSSYNPSTSASVPVTVEAQMATPTFSLPGGTYTSTQTVALSDTTPSATIYYTTDGSTPTTSSAKYQDPIAISKSETLQAIAIAGGYATSAVATATYTITPPAAMPTFSVPSGTYTSAQTVALSDTTPSATIYYTTDGSTPTTSSAKYQGPIAISKSETLQAIAIAGGYATSAVATATYTITPPAAMPTFSVPSGTYTSAQTVAIGDSTAGAVIYYTTDGPSPTTSSAKYQGPIVISKSETLQAIAIAGGYATSAVATATYTITPPAAMPTFSVPSGTYTSAQTVAIGDSTAGAVIYYTTDGSTPTTSSAKYQGPIAISKSETLQAIAIAGGYVKSAVASATYTITPPAAMPTFSVPSGTYTSAQTVALSDTTPSATIYYTTDGSTPTTSSAKYKSPIPVTKSETIQAIAIAGGYATSAVATATYTINLPQPSFTLDSSASELTVSSGSQGSLTLTVTPQNGFNSTVSFACSGLPANTLCSFTPAQVTPTGGVAVTTRLAIGSTASASAARPGGIPFLPAAGLALAGCLLAFTRRRTLRLLLVPIAAIAAFGALSACGGGGSTGGGGGGGGGGGSQSTTTTVTVTATSGSINQSTQITLTVN